MENLLNLLLLPLFFLLFLVFLSEAQLLLLPAIDDEDGGANATQIQTYIIHVVEPHGGHHLGADVLRRWHQSFLPNATLDSGEPRLIYSYRHAISGFAARLTPLELRSVEAMDGFLMAVPSRELSGQTTYTPKSLLGLSDYDGPWRDSNQGEGIIVGVIDSGIIPTHPSFQDVGLPPPPVKWRGGCQFDRATCQSVITNKLIGARTFVGRTPLDQNGHGTHTAGTAAGTFVYNAEVLGQARGTASGTAPRAHISAYRVLDAQNRGQETDFLAGIDQAIQDGVDILSMSLGGQAEPFPRSSIAIASYSAILKGIFPSVCAMNRGPTPTDISNDFPWGLTVGATTHDRRITAVVRLGNNQEFYGESTYQDEDLKGKQYPLVYPGAVDATRQRCLSGAMNGLNVQGKIVICVTGRSEGVEKGKIIKNAGGSGMILINEQNRGFTTLTDANSLPAVNVNHQDAQKIINYLGSTRNPTATIEFKGAQFGYRPSPAVAFFSGRGPSVYNGGIIKPDIVGPGVNILAAWPFEVGPNPTGKTDTFNFDSGTSMSTPHLSGVAALLMKNHPDWSPAAVKSAIMTTARTVDFDGLPMGDEAFDNQPASVFAVGSGHVDPKAANDPGLIYDLQPDDYIPYLCGLYSEREVWTITRKYISCSATGAIRPEQLNYPSIAVNLKSAPSVTLTRTVTNVGDAIEDYNVEIKNSQGIDIQVSPATLRFTGAKQKLSYSVRISAVGKVPSGGKEGEIKWVSSKHAVRSPVAVTF